MNLLKLADKCSTFTIINKIGFLKFCIAKRSFCQNILDINTNVAKDVILYKHNQEKLFRIMNLFAISQFGIWNYLSMFVYTTLKDTPVDKSKENAWWQKINLGENKYKNGLTIISFLIGWGILSITWMYSLRSVRYLILRKGGKEVTIVTYTPIGRNRMFTLNLKNLNCKETRSEAKAYLPLKVKGHYLNYLLDMKGEFKNPVLFDHTAGLRREWKT